MRRLFALLVVTLALVPGLDWAAAQEATPAAGPEVLDPALCRVEPRPLAFFEQFLATPGARSTRMPPPAATTPPLPPGEPAEPETVDGVTATVRELYACLNAGDELRAAALFTDAYFERLFSQFGRLPPEELAGFAAPPRPAPERLWTRLVAVRDVRLLSDGRIGAVVVTDDPVGPPTEPEARFFVFVEADGRFLIDEPIGYLGPVAGTAP